jgi:membrane protein DedA with SNARE-associated domain
LLTHLTDVLQTLIMNFYGTTGLAGIVLAMAIESFCIPLPSEIVMPLAGIMLVQGNLLPGVNHYLALILIALAGAVGNLIGSVAAYWVGYSGGRPLMLKIGRYLLISQHDSDRADRYFQKYGSATAFFSRLLPVVRTYISLPAGVSKMPFGKFCLFTFLGVFPWALLLTYIGTLIGNLSKLSALSSVFHGLDVVVLVALVVLIALYLWRHIRNDRKARAAHAAEAAMPPAQPQQPWGQQQAPFQPAQPGWGQQQQPQQPMQQGWAQQPAQFPPVQPSQMPPGWGQPPSQFQPAPPQQGQGWAQPQPGWGQSSPQQPPQPWSPPPGGENHTMRRN